MARTILGWNYSIQSCPETGTVTSLSVILPNCRVLEHLRGRVPAMQTLLSIVPVSYRIRQPSLLLGGAWFRAAYRLLK